LQTIARYGLLDGLVDASAVIDEYTLEKLRLGLRSLIATQEGDAKDLLDLCIDVVYHNHMKAYGLQQLVELYRKTKSSLEEASQTS
jgi:hypothetical protein